MSLGLTEAAEGCPLSGLVIPRSRRIKCLSPTFGEYSSTAGPVPSASCLIASLSLNACSMLGYDSSCQRVLPQLLSLVERQSLGRPQQSSQRL